MITMGDSSFDRKSQMKKYRTEHKEEIKAYEKKHRKECEEHYKAYRKEYFSRPDVIEKRREYSKNYQRKHREEHLESSKKYYEIHKKELNDNQREHNIKIRIKFLVMYGDKCVCCGESKRIFLTMDHVQNDGNQRREKYGNNNLKEYRIALKEYRPDIYQVLCYNCNHAKHLNGGKCPHQTT
jgi:hypothetical protein